jgi:hypothetical protein
MMVLRLQRVIPIVSHLLQDLRTEGEHMSTAAKPTRENRTITVDFRDEATYVQLLGDGKAFLECVLAFLLALGFQLKHRATCHGGRCLTRHSHYVRIRLGGVTIWRIQCTTCKAVFTVLPHFVLRYRSMRPSVARDALLATHGGLSLELCAVIGHISPMALYRLVCAFGSQSLVTVLTRCGLPLPVYFLADEKHSHCLTDKVYLPTIVHIPLDLVVDPWTSDGESASLRHFLFRPDVWMMFRRQIGEEITSTTSTAWYFTTKSGGI